VVAKVHVHAKFHQVSATVHELSRKQGTKLNYWLATS